MKATLFDQLRRTPEASAAANAASVLSNLSADKNLMEHFYLTGYEGLCLGLSHRELTRSIISSAVPMCGEILVVGENDEVEFWTAICDELRIAATAVVTNGQDAATAVSDVLKEDTCISSVLCSASYGESAIKALCDAAHKRRCSVIVDNASSRVDLAKIEDLGIDFAISTAETEQPVSIIIAKRSRLVMTEGNARQGAHDIYAVWQDSLSCRNPKWVPMA